MILTRNEQRILRFLATSSHRDYSINDIAKAVGISPNGAYKMLTKFKREGILEVKSIANIASYRLCFDEEKTRRIIELAFLPQPLEGRVQLRVKDLQPFKDVTKICILFGSYITTKKEPQDLDILFVLKKEDFDEYKKIMDKVQDITPIKIQDVILAKEDLKTNLEKQNPVVISALRDGIVLWGCDVLVQVIEHVYAR